MGTGALVVEQGTTAATLVAGTGMAEVAPEGKDDIGHEEGVTYII